jgi:hypothetical protein
MQQQMQVTVPAGVGPGQPFQVDTPSGLMQVVCPPNASAGMPMLVNLPSAAAPQPMVMAQAQPVVVQAMPMAVQAMPMEKGETLVMGVPMEQSGNKLLMRMNIDLGGGCEDNSVPTTPPASLSMIRGADWSYLREEIETYRKSNGFSSCPCLESALFLTCCCACVCCPVFIAVGNYDSRQKKLKGVTIPQINAKLAQYGVRCEYSAPGMGEFILFYGP